MVDLSKFDLDIEDLKERMSDLEMEHESVFARLSALETTRATAPVSDDEIVEALAWSWADAGDEPAVRKRFRLILDGLRERGYDVVKRS